MMRTKLAITVCGGLLLGLLLTQVLAQPEASEPPAPQQQAAPEPGQPAMEPGRQTTEPVDDDGGEASVRPARRPTMPRLTQEQEQEMLDALRERDANMYRQLEELRQSDPERYHATLRRVWPWYNRWRNLPLDLQDAMLRMRDNGEELGRLAQEYRRATAEQRPLLERRMRQVLVRQVDDEQLLSEYRVRQLEAQIEQLKAQMQQRRREREQIVAERLERVLRGPSRPETHRAEAGTPPGERSERPQRPERPAPGHTEPGPRREPTRPRP